MGTRAFYFIFYPVCCRAWSLCGRLQFLVCFCIPILFSFLETKNQKASQDASKLYFCNAERRRRRCVESCARAAHIHTQRERMKKKEEILYIRKAAATSECPSVQPETSGPPLEQVTTQKKTKVMCLRHPFSRLAATRCHDNNNNNILLFRLLLLYYFAISGKPTTMCRMQLTKYRRAFESLKSNGVESKSSGQCAR